MIAVKELRERFYEFRIIIHLKETSVLDPEVEVS